MTDRDGNQSPDSVPQDADRGSIEQIDRDQSDTRSDIEQAVEARSDAVARGEGGKEPVDDPLAGAGGSGGEVRNQHDDAQ